MADEAVKVTVGGRTIELSGHAALAYSIINREQNEAFSRLSYESGGAGSHAIWGDILSVSQQALDAAAEAAKRGEDASKAYLEAMKAAGRDTGYAHIATDISAARSQIEAYKRLDAAKAEEEARAVDTVDVDKDGKPDVSIARDGTVTLHTKDGKEIKLDGAAAQQVRQLRSQSEEARRAIRADRGIDTASDGQIRYSDETYRLSSLGGRADAQLEHGVLAALRAAQTGEEPSKAFLDEQQRVVAEQQARDAGRLPR